MAEYVERQKAIDLFYPVDPENDGSDGATLVCQSLNYSSADVESILSDMPAEDVAPVRHGRWDNIPNTYMCVAGKDGSYHGNATSCSACNEINPNAYKTNYCPNCGAKMDLEVPEK